MIEDMINRPLEIGTIDDASAPNRGKDFFLDYIQYVVHCLKNNDFKTDPRRGANMPPEPYRVDYEKVAAGLPLLQHAIDYVGQHTKDWQLLYSSLADGLSKDLLIVLLAYRAIGYKYVKLPLNCEEFYSVMRDIGTKFLSLPQREVTSDKIELKEYHVSVNDTVVTLLTNPFGVINEFLYSQYVYRGADIVGPQAGNTIVDCGACFGGTSLFFAALAGPMGKVYSFEFIKDNVATFRENLSKNPTLQDRVTIVERPVWKELGVKMYMKGTGPSASMTTDSLSGGEEIETYTIDDLVTDQKLERIDFIKMDIEGAEVAALRGAANTIKTFKPKLAISVYHRVSDFYEVPRVIGNMRKDYRFYLQHSTPHGDETVLFAF